MRAGFLNRSAPRPYDAEHRPLYPARRRKFRAVEKRLACYALLPVDQAPYSLALTHKAVKKPLRPIETGRDCFVNFGWYGRLIARTKRAICLNQ